MTKTELSRVTDFLIENGFHEYCLRTYSSPSDRCVVSFDSHAGPYESVSAILEFREVGFISCPVRNTGDFVVCEIDVSEASGFTNGSQLIESLVNEDEMRAFCIRATHSTLGDALIVARSVEFTQERDNPAR